MKYRSLIYQEIVEIYTGKFTKVSRGIPLESSLSP